MNTGLDEIQTESIPSVCSGYQSYADSQTVLEGHQVPVFSTEYQAYQDFLAQNVRRIQ